MKARIEAMNVITPEERQQALKGIDSTISKCEKIQPKFKEGTSQHTLLRNRIKALKIAKSLVEADGQVQVYTMEDLEQALPPIVSIIHKTEKAQSKYEEGNVYYKRFAPLIAVMYVSKALVEKEIMERNCINE